MIYHKHNKKKSNKGIANSMVSTILVIVAAGVVLMIIISGLNNNWAALKNIFSKYSSPKINDTTAFLYSITDLKISNANEVGCTEDASNLGTFRCPSGKYVDFSVSIRNGGTMMRKVYGTIIVCKAECRRGTCQPTKECNDKLTKGISDTNGESCFVAKDEVLECEAGSYQFSPGSYIVYPVATCALQQDVGCYSPAMREADKIFNSKESLNVIVS